MKIKTIVHDNPGEFDNQVNKMLEEGYILSRRGLENVGGRSVKLYAEMVKPDLAAEPEPMDLVESMLAIQAECNRFRSCEDCTLQAWCDFRAPSDWRLPAEEAPTA